MTLRKLNYLLVVFLTIALLVVGSTVSYAKPPGGGGGDAPAAPSNLSAVAVSSSQINLSWVDNSGNESGFKIERSSDGSSFSQIAVVGKDVVSYSDTGLNAITQYYYRVRAYKGNKDSSYSNTASATTHDVVPSAPSNLVATVSYGPTKVAVSWTDNSSNEDDFVLERRVNGGSYSVLATLSPNATSVTGGNTYEYKVKATNEAGSSSYSNTDSEFVESAPSAPSNLTAVASIETIGTTSISVINVDWTDNSSNEDSFKLEYGTNGTNFFLLATFSSNTTSYTHQGVVTGTTYYYRVYATNEAGNSSYSNVDSDQGL
jgi:hypothetical protein